MSDADDLNLIITNKKIANDIYHKYCTTPDVNEGDWNDAVLEARGHGIPIASFGDTLDKIVLHAGHLKYKFDYMFGRDTWGDDMWEEVTNDDKKKKVRERLLNIGKQLLEKYTIYAVTIHGSCKGYLSTTFNLINKDTELENFDVLFVYCNNRSILE